MIKAKKSLGQNFLIDENVLKKIVSLKEIKNKFILEIGPGTGNLTQHILNKGPKKLIAVEKDKNLAFFLKEKFNDKITIINDDILKTNEKSLNKEKLIVFGNLPYNISTEILAKWILNLDHKNFWFDYLILMFQKEVAERIISKFNSSTYGRLTILANWRLNINKICDIKPISFFPKPKVDSTLLLFEPKEIFYPLKNPKNLEKITRIFFNQRRKKLKNPFNILFKNKVNLPTKLGIDLNLRPHNLKPEVYYELTKEYENL
ncbi:16S rRNA (adenine(1518)-N(6)/adenine(1519)-N(6))-dimethyltransferase RsmA [Candidatus Pelagibacter sp.]|nr:16S rRNA (adenine(1518)-N(6)/adenine(1519)-N(6))-dimethyltransferase RsmA [Candidatus Pelagibacter sp.]